MQALLAYASAFAYDYSHLDADGSRRRPPEWVLGAFGEKLRKQREQRGMALDAISNVTKISTRMLRALEDERFDQLPGGVFNKGFVRAYARQIGLNEEEALSDYLAALRESQIQSQNILPDFRKPLDVAAPVSSRPTRRDRDRKSVNDNNLGNDFRKNDVPKNDFRKSEVLGSDPRENDLRQENLPRDNVSGNGGGNEALKADRRKKDRRSQARDDDDRSSNKQSVLQAESSSSRITTATLAETQRGPDKPSAAIPWGKLAAALLVVSAVLAFWNLRRQNQATSVTPPATTSNQAPATVASAPPAVPLPQPTSDSGSAKTGQTEIGHVPRVVEAASEKSAAAPVASTSSSSANPPTAKPSVGSATEKPPSTFTLLVRAEKTTWVTITADGKPVTQEMLIAPAQTSIRAAREIVVKAGNAAGISFLLNGKKEIPAQGSDGEVKTYTFDANGMKTSSARPSDTEQ